MNQEKWIKEIIGEAIIEVGFNYLGKSSDEHLLDYTYLKQNEDLKQYISLVVSGNEIKLVFQTNAFGQSNVIATNCMESEFEKGFAGEWLVWKNEEEFKTILYHFREIILQKGFDILEELSKPTTDARPTKQAHWKLYQEHEALNQKYRSLYGMEDTEFTAKLVRRISAVILEHKDVEFKEVEELLTGLAAVYGDQLIRKCGGSWQWNAECNCCMILGLHEGTGSENPLAAVINYWRSGKEFLELFYSHFKKNPFDSVI